MAEGEIDEDDGTAPPPPGAAEGKSVLGKSIMLGIGEGLMGEMLPVMTVSRSSATKDIRNRR